MGKITRHVAIDIALDEKIKRHCAETGEKYNVFIRKCVKKYLENEERPDRYATLELLHFGDPEKKTGIYAEQRKMDSGLQVGTFIDDGFIKTITSDIGDVERGEVQYGK